jgi:predicted TIM-barrel fold metal-dependent hydrolase
VKLPGGGEAQVMPGQEMRVEPGRKLRNHDTRYEPQGGSFEDNDGAGPPEQRIEEQDLDGVDAEVLFPGTAGGPNLWRGGIKDDEAYADVVAAYNGWLAEEYCAVAPDRLIGLGLVPEVDARTAVAELEHCKRSGLKGVQLNSFPSGQMVPTPEDDYFWAAAVEMDMPLTAHVWFRHGASYDGPLFRYPKMPEGPVKASARDPLQRFLSFGNRAARDVIRLVFAGVFDRFPTLNIYFAETQIGWVPQWLEHADDAYERYHPWANEVFGLPALQRLPSEYVKEHFLWGVMFNPFGVRNRYEIGVDKIMWESDFPHPGTDWPHSQRTIERNFAGVPEDERYQMLAGNAVKFFHLETA